MFEMLAKQVRKTAFFVAVCLMAIPLGPPAYAGDGDLQSAGWFLDICRRHVEDPDAPPDLLNAMNTGACLGFINGFAKSKQIADVAAAQAYVSELGISPIDAVERAQLITDTMYGCLAQTTYRQQAAVFVKYARAHPETWHEDVQIVFLDAMKEAFPPPCD